MPPQKHKPSRSEMFTIYRVKVKNKTNKLKLAYIIINYNYHRKQEEYKHCFRFPKDSAHYMEWICNSKFTLTPLCYVTKILELGRETMSNVQILHLNDVLANNYFDNVQIFQSGFVNICDYFSFLNYLQMLTVRTALYFNKMDTRICIFKHPIETIYSLNICFGCS